MRRTGGGHGGKHPALSVFHRLGSVAQVVLKDLGTAGPDPRANAVFERALPFAFEKTEAIVGIDLFK